MSGDRLGDIIKRRSGFVPVVPNFTRPLTTPTGLEHDTHTLKFEE
jgi:hypothetical protein